MRSLLPVFVLAACGGSHKTTSDGPPPDMQIDAPKMCMHPPDAGTSDDHYIIDHEIVPQNNSQARTYGLDLNNDGTVDNQLGMVFGSLATMGFDSQTSAQTAVDRGVTLLLFDLATTDFTTATGAAGTTYYGASPCPDPCDGASDTTCRHHLTGSGDFTIATSSPRDTPLVGNAAAGTFDLGPGHLGIEVAAIEPATPLVLSLIGARVRLSGANATGITSGILAGAVTQSDVMNVLEPQMAMQFQAIVYRDCCGQPTSPGGATCNPNGSPACGCTSNSQGASVINLFDTSPKDCMISTSEVQNNSLIQSLLAPDVTVEGQQALSLGIGITAVAASYAL